MGVCVCHKSRGPECGGGLARRLVRGSGMSVSVEKNHSAWDSMADRQ
eukprot:COSAG02_NODE_60600_length_271_cov_0.505814_1_plen_46_part_01